MVRGSCKFPIPPGSDRREDPCRFREKSGPGTHNRAPLRARARVQPLRRLHPEYNQPGINRDQGGDDKASPNRTQ